MRHRHLEVPDDYHSVATILSVLERGTSQDVIALLKQLGASPFSELADEALVACDQSNVYGYPALIRLCLRHWRGLDAC